MTENNFILKSNNINIYCRTWNKENYSKIAIICHGIFEHSKRYSELAKFLSNEGYKVYAYDHPGHGRSEGRKAHIDSFNIFITTLNDFINHVYSKENKKITLIGHSMGGLISLHYLINYPDYSKIIEKLIFSSPSLSIPLFKPSLLLANTLLKIIPKVKIPALIWPHKLTRDKERVSAIKNDPYIKSMGTVSLLAGLVKYMHLVQSHQIIPLVPTLCLIAGKDSVIVAKKTLEYFSKMPQDKVKIKLYDDSFHELFHDINRYEVFKDVTFWLNQK